MSTFRNLIAPYLDPNGFVLNPSFIIDGNATLYNGIMAVFLDLCGELDPLADRNAFRQRLEMVEQYPGEIQRAYKPADFQAHDDYIGAMAEDFLVNNGEFSERVVAYGRHHWWSWNNLSPTWSLRGFFVRHPGFWAFAKTCSKTAWVMPWDQAYAAFGLVLTAIVDDGSSDHNMDFVKIHIYDKISWWKQPITKLGVVAARALYKSAHPRGRVESFEEFFGVNHPFAVTAGDKSW